MLVEDNPADVTLVRKALRAAQVNAELQVVRDGESAMLIFDVIDADLNAHPPELLLLDLNIPKRNGEEVLRHIRATARSRDTRVVIVTTPGSPRDRTPFTALGVAAYFCKTSDYEEFMELGLIVRTLLR